MANASLVSSLDADIHPAPQGLDHADHRLPAGMNVDVLNCDLLLALAAVAIERVEQHRVGA
jgi:hypothetical protein